MRAWSLVIVLAVAVPLLVVKATHTIANSKAGRTVDVARPATTSRLPDTPAALLVMNGADGTVPGSPCSPSTDSGSGGTALVVPGRHRGPRRRGGQPGTRLGDAYADGGLAAEREAVEGVLGITTSVAEQVDRGRRWRRCSSRTRRSHVTLDGPVPSTPAPAGKAVVLYPAGPVDLTADQAAQLLVAHGPNESEIARLPRTTAIWAAVLGAAAGRDVPDDRRPRPATTWARRRPAGGRGRRRSSACSRCRCGRCSTPSPTRTASTCCSPTTPP